MGQAGVLSQGASPAASGLAGERRTGSGGRTVAARSAERIPAKETDRGGAGKPGRSACLVGQFPARKHKTKQNKMWLKKKKGRVACLWTPALCVRRTSSSSPLFGPQRPRWGERLVTRNLCGNPGASRSRFLKSFPQTWRHATQEPRAPPCAGHEPDSGDAER